MRGKYSPTVTCAYMKDQDWFRKYSQGEIYDPEGYDSYGYDKNDVDRAGNEEYEYYSNDAPFDLDIDYNNKYDGALEAWGFDGVKPVPRT